MPGIDISYEGALPFFATLGYDDRGEAVSMERGLFDYALPRRRASGSKSCAMGACASSHFPRSILMRPSIS